MLSAIGLIFLFIAGLFITLAGVFMLWLSLSFSIHKWQKILALIYVVVGSYLLYYGSTFIHVSVG